MPISPVAPIEQARWMAGQYDISERLVEFIHRTFEGFHPGHRGVHANGSYYAATFVGSSAAPRISRAIHLQGNTDPATVRFSNSLSGSPAGPARSVSMATKFFLPNGTVRPQAWR